MTVSAAQGSGVNPMLVLFVFHYKSSLKLKWYSLEIRNGKIFDNG